MIRISSLIYGRLVCQLSTYVCVCLSVCRCLLLSVFVYSYMYVSMCLCVYVSIYVLSTVFVCRYVACLSGHGGRSGCCSFSQSVCLFACLCLSIYVCLSVVWRFGGRSLVFFSCQSVTIRTKCAGSGGEDDGSKRAKGFAHKSNRLRTQERQVGLVNVELRTEAESRGLRARS